MTWQDAPGFVGKMLAWKKGALQTASEGNIAGCGEAEVELKNESWQGRRFGISLLQTEAHVH